jgi:AcrR family transcriptional regulator
MADQPVPPARTAPPVPPARTAPPVPPARTARDRARQEITAEILATARRHLATDGAAGLSLRAVARELGFASSAVYRYVPSREELLTELLISSYDDLGSSVEHAAATSLEQPPARRWVVVAAAIRTWAVEHPHEWALLYGSPVPGYQAPERTIGPGIRASLALLGVLRDAARSGWRPPSTEVDEQLGEDLVALGATLGLPADLDRGAAVAVVAAWTQTFRAGELRGLRADRGHGRLGRAALRRRVAGDRRRAGPGRRRAVRSVSRADRWVAPIGESRTDP